MNNFIKKILIYSPPEKKENNSNDQALTSTSLNKPIHTKLSQNLDYLQATYNSIISKDIIIRNFKININTKPLSAALIYIDGMANAKNINQFILKPLLNKKINLPQEFTPKDLESIMPESDIKPILTQNDLLSSINSGNSILLLDNSQIAYSFDEKGFKQREIGTPQNEMAIRGSQESFVENLRTNTSILRRLINSEKLVMEDLTVGETTKTKVTICYLSNKADSSLITEINYRINNLNIDYLTSSGQLEQLIQDYPNNLFPQTIATERPDKAIPYILEGRAAIIVNGSPYVLIVPCVFNDFLSSPEDFNIKYQYSNLQKFIRLLATFFSILLPGIYISTTCYHQELIPTELLFTITKSRESVPFPVLIEILLMEISFELIREAGIRVPSPLGSTIGIVGALILGESAVSASLVSPVLIIIVAITGICSFSIPDFSMNFAFRICRFIYIILGYLGGFLGISCGLFVQLLFMCNLSSFGAPYLSANSILKNTRTNTSIFLSPIWKREKTSEFIHSKKPYLQSKISMKWRNNK